MLDINWIPIQVKSVINDPFRVFALFLLAVLAVIIIINAE